MFPLLLQYEYRIFMTYPKLMEEGIFFLPPKEILRNTTAKKISLSPGESPEGYTIPGDSNLITSGQGRVSPTEQNAETKSPLSPQSEIHPEKQKSQA